MKWWEKTVEYFFILKVLSERMVIAPFDGNEEKAGDAVLSSGNKWILIEFKKDKSSVKSEEKKFYDYEAARDALVDRDLHHYIIYGGIVPGLTKFGVAIQTYFSKNPVSDVDKLLDGAKEKNDFIDYLEEFLRYKSEPSDPGGGGPGPGVSDYAMVAGIRAVDGSNKVVECMSLDECTELVFNAPPPTTTPTPPKQKPQVRFG